MQTISDDKLQPQTQQEEMQPGNEPQQICHHSENIPHGYEPPHIENFSPAAREAFDDMLQLFLSTQKNTSKDVCYTLLSEKTRTYIRSLRSEMIS